MLGTVPRQGPTTSNHKHIKKSEFTIKITRAVNEDYKLIAGLDDEWVYVPDKTARKNKVVQCNEEDIDAEIDKGFIEDLKKLGKRTASELDLDLRFEKRRAKRTASALERSQLAWALRPDATPKAEKKKKRR